MTREAAHLVVVAAVVLGSSGCPGNAQDKVQLPANAAVGASPTPAAKPTAPASAPAAATGGAIAPTQVANAPAAAVSGGALTGTTEPYRRSTLMPHGGGSVLKVEVGEGDRVKRGQVLVVLDTSNSRLQLKQAEAGRAFARAQLDAVRIEWRRLQGLVKAKAIPRGEFEKVDAQLKVAAAGLAQADAGIALARKMIADGVTRAPFDGLITAVKVEVGQWVATMPPTVLMVLEQVDKLKLRVQAPETAMQRVAVGTPLQIRFSAIGKTVRAKVTQVVPSLNPMTRSFAVIAELDNKDGGLRPGMFAEVDLLEGAERGR